MLIWIDLKMWRSKTGLNFEQISKGWRRRRRKRRRGRGRGLKFHYTNYSGADFELLLLILSFHLLTAFDFLLNFNWFLLIFISMKLQYLTINLHDFEWSIKWPSHIFNLRCSTSESSLSFCLKFRRDQVWVEGLTRKSIRGVNAVKKQSKPLQRWQFYSDFPLRWHFL